MERYTTFWKSLLAVYWCIYPPWCSFLPREAASICNHFLPAKLLSPRICRRRVPLAFSYLKMLPSFRFRGCLHQAPAWGGCFPSAPGCYVPCLLVPDERQPFGQLPCLACFCLALWVFSFSLLSGLTLIHIYVGTLSFAWSSLTLDLQIDFTHQFRKVLSLVLSGCFCSISSVSETLVIFTLSLFWSQKPQMICFIFCFSFFFFFFLIKMLGFWLHCVSSSSQVLSLLVFNFLAKMCFLSEIYICLLKSFCTTEILHPLYACHLPFYPVLCVCAVTGDLAYWAISPAQLLLLFLKEQLSHPG